MNVTSIKGRVAVPHDVGYCASKYAAEAFSDILRREMHKFGVKVSIVEPGYFDGATGMLNKEYVRISVIINFYTYMDGSRRGTGGPDPLS